MRTSRFSAFSFSAWLVKLKLPVMSVRWSMTMTLLWAMACVGVDQRRETLLHEELQIGVFFLFVAVVEDDLDVEAAQLGVHERLGDGLAGE